MSDEHKTYIAVASGREHLERILLGTQAVSEQSFSGLRDHESECALIGTAVSALFQAATCHRGCNRGPHIFEALCGRAYNLGASSYILAAGGFYDEASNLIRSIAEIGNLISLSVSDPQLFKDWLSSDAPTRKTKFSPVKIRVALEKTQGIQIADEGWYSKFCEAYTHITPDTKPGMHNQTGKGNVGGVYQPDGLSTTLGELATVLGALAMFVCKYFKFEDLFAELQKIVVSAESSAQTEA